MTLPDSQASIDAALVSMLLGVMPLSKADETAIRRALKRAEQARDAYHARIVEANEHGASVRDIAKILGVSHQTVANIIRAYSSR